MSKKIEEKVIENIEVTEEAVDAVEESEIAVPEKENIVAKVGGSVKRGVPKIAKIAAVGALTVAGFILGVKVGKKSGDSDYIECDGYEVLDGDSEGDTNE